LGVAPLFHVTGLVAHLGVSFLTGAPLVLAHRFDAATMLAAAARHRATFTVASITAYIALLNDPHARDHDLSTLTKAYSRGELVIEGPQVVPGYWQRADATLPLRTGDVAVMDNAGWFYIVDRKKDQINASGFKVWPREVEDVLYRHEAVREAAVVGVPDAYR